MAKRDQATGTSPATEVTEQVRALLSAAEGTAKAIREEAEQEAQNRRREAEAEALLFVEEARRQADALVADRRRQIGDLSDSLIERAQAVLERLERADAVRGQLQSLVGALGQAAERIAAEESGEFGGPRLVGDAANAPTKRFQRPAAGEQGTPAAPEGSQAEGAQAGDDGSPDGEKADDEPHPDPLPELRDEDPAQDGEDASAADGLDGSRLVALQMAVAGSTRAEVGAHLEVTFGLSDPDAILDDVFGEGTPSEARRDNASKIEH